MSLLNDMLRDLSQTQKATGSPMDQVHSQAHNEPINIIKQEPVTLWPSFLIFIVVLAMLLIWNQREEKSGDEPDSVQIAQPIVEQVKETIASPANDDHQSDSSELNNDVISDVQIPSPAKDSTEILNERLAALETAITTLSSVVQQSNHSLDAQQLPDETAASELEPLEEIDQASVSIRDPFETQDSTAQQYSGVDEFSYDESNSVTEEDVIPEDAHFTIEPNKVFQDQRQAEQGRYLHEQGHTQDAIAELQNYIAMSKEPRESTLALLDIFSQQQNASEIHKTLGTATYLAAVDQKYYKAKAAVIDDKESYAIELLEANISEAEAHENYRAFLAGLYQRTGKYSEAATAYRRLLSQFGEKPAYWLGFALAQDSLNQNNTAKQAYLRLAQYSGLQPEVRDYIQQRLAALP